MKDNSFLAKNLANIIRKLYELAESHIVIFIFFRKQEIFIKNYRKNMYKHFCPFLPMYTFNI